MHGSPYEYTHSAISIYNYPEVYHATRVHPFNIQFIDLKVFKIACIPSQNTYSSCKFWLSAIKTITIDKTIKCFDSYSHEVKSYSEGNQVYSHQ